MQTCDMADRDRQRPPLSPLRLWRVVAAAMRRRRDRQCLAKLDAHLLADIGLTSAQAAAELEKPFWRD
jgi:uncharacterized protein YjiS (DUF1127 family)